MVANSCASLGILPFDPSLPLEWSDFSSDSNLACSLGFCLNPPSFMKSFLEPPRGRGDELQRPPPPFCWCLFMIMLSIICVLACDRKSTGLAVGDQTGVWPNQTCGNKGKPFVFSKPQFFSLWQRKLETMVTKCLRVVPSECTFSSFCKFPWGSHFPLLQNFLTLIVSC